ncbi:hypothetical protein C2U65_15720, partial [Acinetobacter baumannii]
AVLSWNEAISMIGIRSGATINPRAMTFRFGMIFQPYCSLIIKEGIQQTAKKTTFYVFFHFHTMQRGML